MSKEKHYRVIFKRKFEIYVDAESKEEAEQEAWDLLEQDSEFDPWDFEVEVIEE